MAGDVERLRRDVSLSRTAASFGVSLARDGDEHIGLCPFHAEETASFTVFTGKDHVERFHCFGCGERGDVLDFTQKIKGVDLKEAISILGGETTSRPNIAPKQVEARDVYAGITTLDPARSIVAGNKVRLYNPKRAGTEKQWGSFAPSAAYPYFSGGVTPIGYVLRHDLPDGRKETPMVMWVRLPDGTECWSRFPFPKPRPLYGLKDLRDGQVIVVEGEKCRDALAQASGRNVVSWAGGTYGVEHADWTPLAGRSIVIWPDADAPGRKTAERIATILVGLGCTVKIMAIEDRPDGWDCADAIKDGWSKDDLDAFMRATVRPFEAVRPVDAPHPPAGSEPAVQDWANEYDRAVERGRTVTQMRTVEQAQPATVTHIHTRKTVAADDSWRMHLVTNDEGKTKPGITKNWSLFIENHKEMAGVFAFDAFKQVVTLLRRPPWEDEGSSWEPRTLKDRDYSETVIWLEQFHLTPKASNIVPVVQMVAERATFDPLTEYLEGLQWDGKPRVARFANDYLGCAGDNYAPIVSERWLISSVARGLKPGSKVDTMPILEGAQGARKSSALRKLYGDRFFTDGLSDIGSKDAKMEMQGVWGLEVAEMQKFNQAETNEVKKFLTQQIDRFRPPYGRTIIEAPRRVVLCGTINPEGNPYLRDPTGARRFWPLEVGHIDLDGIERDRDQIWAEAVALYRAGTPWWVQENEQEAVASEQERRTDVDVWVDLVAPLLKTRTSIAQVELFKELGIPMKEQDKRHADRIGRIMKKLGWSEKRDRHDGDRKIYIDPEKFGQQQYADDEVW